MHQISGVLNQLKKQTHPEHSQNARLDGCVEGVCKKQIAVRRFSSAGHLKPVDSLTKELMKGLQGTRSPVHTPPDDRCG